MHNNGTTPLILPNKRLLPDLAPQAAVGIQVTAAGVVMTTELGAQQLPICLAPEQAVQIGVNLISGAAMLQRALHDAAQATHIIAPEPEPEVSLD